MKILIIGGTSFIGPQVVKLLSAAEGHELCVFHRGHTKAELPDSVRHIYGDHKQLPSSKESFESFSPDVVLDMILSTEEDAQSLVQTFQGITSRIVAISSQDVYRAYGIARDLEIGGTEPLPITEQSSLRSIFYPYQDSSKDPQDWCNTYDKILVERVIMSNHTLQGTVLRLPAVYGPMDGQHRFYSYLNLKRMLDQRPFILLDESFAQWRWTHAYVENVASAIALAVTDERSAGQIYNVGEPDTPTMYEFTKRIGEQLNWNGDIVVVPNERLPNCFHFALNTSQQLIVDSSLIRAGLNYHETVSRIEGLNQTMKWEVQNLPTSTNPKYQNIDYEVEDPIIKKLGLS